MEIKSEAEMLFKISLELTETEARALVEITRYGSKNFLEVFYEKLGKSGLQPYEKGIISLFNTASTKLPKHFYRIDETRKAFNKKV